MDHYALVRCDVEAGIRLADGLEALNVPVSACLWYYFSRVERWQLLIATPLVDEIGFSRAFRRFDKARRKLTPPNDIHWLDIDVVSPKHYIVKLLKARFGTGAKAVGRKVDWENIRGVIVEGAYICRMQ